jgi:hypothetical protein
VKPLALSAETQAILRRIRTYGWTLNVYGMSSSQSLRLVKARTDIRINKAGVSPPYSNVYRRYVVEVVKTFRTETGESLARAIQLVIRKWTNLGLTLPLLQGLLADCFLRFEQQGYAMPKAKHPGGRPKPRRRRTTYEAALKKGRAALGGANTVEEQAARQQQGAAFAAAIARRLRPILQARGITGRGFLPYFNFAQKLGRLSRKYADKSLQMAAADLVDYYEAKTLNHDTLLAICTSLFGVDSPS